MIDFRQNLIANNNISILRGTLFLTEQLYKNSKANIPLKTIAI